SRLERRLLDPEELRQLPDHPLVSGLLEVAVEGNGPRGNVSRAHDAVAVADRAARRGGCDLAEVERNDLAARGLTFRSGLQEPQPNQEGAEQGDDDDANDADSDAT